MTYYYYRITWPVVFIVSLIFTQLLNGLLTITPLSRQLCVGKSIAQGPQNTTSSCLLYRVYVSDI